MGTSAPFFLTRIDASAAEPFTELRKRAQAVFRPCRAVTTKARFVPTRLLDTGLLI
jgi:hypothetical protein